MKTLGQLAQEAFDAGPHDHSKTFTQQKSLWFELAAQAVRAAVIEECAKVCESLKEKGDKLNADDIRAIDYCADTIRSLK